MENPIRALHAFFIQLRRRKAYAHCDECGSRLSEWFIDRRKGISETLGMVCIYCGAVSPWLCHENYRQNYIQPAAGWEPKRPPALSPEERERRQGTPVVERMGGEGE